MTDNLELINDSILFLLKPKRSIGYLESRWTLRQALEKMRYYGYTALPVIDEYGKYVPDFSSRYFTEDFPYGMRFIVEVAEKNQIEVPIIQRVYNWGMKMIRQYGI